MKRQEGSITSQQKCSLCFAGWKIGARLRIRKDANNQVRSSKE